MMDSSLTASQESLITTADELDFEPEKVMFFYCIYCLNLGLVLLFNIIIININLLILYFIKQFLLIY